MKKFAMVCLLLSLSSLAQADELISLLKNEGYKYCEAQLHANPEEFKPSGALTYCRKGIDLSLAAPEKGLTLRKECVIPESEWIGPAKLETESFCDKGVLFVLQAVKTEKYKSLVTSSPSTSSTLQQQLTQCQGKLSSIEQLIDSKNPQLSNTSAIKNAINAVQAGSNESSASSSARGTGK